jgi:hypothetical protein
MWHYVRVRVNKGVNERLFLFCFQKYSNCYSFQNKQQLGMSGDELFYRAANKGGSSTLTHAVQLCEGSDE